MHIKTLAVVLSLVSLSTLLVTDENIENAFNNGGPGPGRNTADAIALAYTLNLFLGGGTEGKVWGVTTRVGHPTKVAGTVLALKQEPCGDTFNDKFSLTRGSETSIGAVLSAFYDNRYVSSFSRQFLFFHGAASGFAGESSLGVQPAQKGDNFWYIELERLVPDVWTVEAFAQLAKAALKKANVAFTLQKLHTFAMATKRYGYLHNDFQADPSKQTSYRLLAGGDQRWCYRFRDAKNAFLWCMSSTETLNYQAVILDHGQASMDEKSGRATLSSDNRLMASEDVQGCNSEDVKVIGKTALDYGTIFATLNTTAFAPYGVKALPEGAVLYGDRRMKFGFLKKRGALDGSKGWKTRYFVLESDKMLGYYKEELPLTYTDRACLKKFINLRGATVLDDCGGILEARRSADCFTLSVNGRNYWIAPDSGKLSGVDSPTLAGQWKLAIRAVIDNTY